MKGEEFLRMARHAGFGTFVELWGVNLLRFAALVAAAEREKCAQFVASTEPEDWAHLTQQQLAQALRDQKDDLQEFFPQ